MGVVSLSAVFSLLSFGTLVIAVKIVCQTIHFPLDFLAAISPPLLKVL